MPKKQIWGFPRKHRGTRSTEIRPISTSAASPSTSSKAISSPFSPNNLNGTQIFGRIIRVDHCEKYKKKEEEDEETEMEKREA